jgi:2',3'-cyclic-nucleotide 2'-phosphodiesterase (5'-nucleotidase family)
MKRKLYPILALVLVLGLFAPSFAPAAAASTISFTILHTNDFHGQLEASGSNPGMARVAALVEQQRAALGAGNVLLVDAGDEMQGSLLSNLTKGEATIAAFNAMQYQVATFGNHEFDWGQDVLSARTAQASYPFVTANIVKKAADGSCTGWDAPAFAKPYQVITAGTAPNQVRVGFIGVTTTETPVITVSTATQGLCFKDPTDSILHYYDELAGKSDVIVVLSHLGYADGGYGYGIPVYGDQTLAKNLINAGKPVPLIIGGHSHTNLSAATVVTVSGKPGSTSVVQAYYNGRNLGEADLTFDPATRQVTVSWQRILVSTSGPEDATVKGVIQSYANNPDYMARINQPVGYAQTDLSRNYNGDQVMGEFVDDAIYNYLNSDNQPSNDVDLFFNNAGGIRTDWCDKPDPAHAGNFIWSSDPADCQPGVWSHGPMLLTYGMMFTILPFGNATVVGEMTGAQILDLLNQSATLGKGALQPAGLRYKFYSYSDSLPGPQPYAWGGYDACVVDKHSGQCKPLDLAATYKVGTNEFLAPAGGDNYAAFKYMKNITYWGDMLDAVDAYVAQNYGQSNPYRGPTGTGDVDGRITRETDVVPVTLLHHNDSHGRLLPSGSYPGYTQLATVIKQERAHNPDRTLLFSLGDNIQGDSMSYYFKNAGMGVGADGSTLPLGLWINPFVAAMDSMNYTGMVLGNHEFNFGPQVFDTTFGQAAFFPLLGANMDDSGAYGINKVGLPHGQSTQWTSQVVTDGSKVNVYDGLELGVSSGLADDPVIKLGFLGLTNHRVPNYELPSNIPGLTFYDPIKTAQRLVPVLAARNDAVVALTHIGFTEDPSSVEVDQNVDTNLAASVRGIDTILGGHSHTNPATGFGSYKYLPALVVGAGDTPVLINQAYRYNTYLGEVVLGFKERPGQGFDLVSQAGRDIAITSATPEDPAVKAIVDPYQAVLNSYNNTVIGTTVVPIDTLQSFTEETNGANLQADASVWELKQHDVTPDFHLSGAMTNSKIADSATPATPYTLKVADMFKAMPYENSLLVLRMNGPQIKAVLERAYRNYYYYKYVPGYGGYSHYPTCMLDTDAGNQIVYRDAYPALPDGNNVVAFKFKGTPIDFTDKNTYYNVSTVNYLAAGSCNFNDQGVSLWPLSQIAADTQYYVRDAVIDYVKALTKPVDAGIEGRIQFVK